MIGDMPDIAVSIVKSGKRRAVLANRAVSPMRQGLRDHRRTRCRTAHDEGRVGLCSALESEGFDTMSNHLSSLLEAWRKAKSETNWVLGTVYKTEGSTYRKAGSLMLVNGLGQRFGLLSGGCLEADIVQTPKGHDDAAPVDADVRRFGRGRHVFPTGNRLWRHGPYHAATDWIGERSWTSRYGGRPGQARPGHLSAKDRRLGIPFQYRRRAILADSRRRGGDWLITPIVPEPHLLVVGGGSDAKPLVGSPKTWVGG